MGFDLVRLTPDAAPLLRRAAVATLTRMNQAEGINAAQPLLAVDGLHKYFVIKTGGFLS